MRNTFPSRSTICSFVHFYFFDCACRKYPVRDVVTFSYLLFSESKALGNLKICDLGRGFSNWPLFGFKTIRKTYRVIISPFEVTRRPDLCHMRSSHICGRKFTITTIKGRKLTAIYLWLF